MDDKPFEKRPNDRVHSRTIIKKLTLSYGRSQWPRGLRRRSAAARLLRSWVRIPPGAWMFVECCVLSGKGLCDELITRPEESYRLWCVVVCDLETSRIRRPWPALGRGATAQKKTLSYEPEFIYITFKLPALRHIKTPRLYFKDPQAKTVYTKNRCLPRRREVHTASWRVTYCSGNQHQRRWAVTFYRHSWYQ